MDCNYNWVLKYQSLNRSESRNTNKIENESENQIKNQRTPKEVKMKIKFQNVSAQLFSIIFGKESSLYKKAYNANKISSLVHHIIPISPSLRVPFAQPV